ncbi:hypothetical protein DFP73DRAFT_620872 [Morchella snyderi]|nr:hypothetical protein DFP73DRAFT_620872 [Morchella snyderi]
MSDNDLIPTLTSRTSSTTRSYWRQLNQPRMEGPYPVMLGANSSQESSCSGNRSSSSTQSRHSSTTKPSSYSAQSGSEFMESISSTPPTRSQDQRPNNRSQSSRGRDSGPGRQTTFGGKPHAPRHMPPTQQGILIHPQPSYPYGGRTANHRNKIHSRERANALHVTDPAHHSDSSHPPPPSGRYGNQPGDHRPRGGSAGPMGGRRPMNPFREVPVYRDGHSYSHDENIPVYRGRRERSLDSMNARNTMGQSNNNKSYNSSSSSSRYEKRSVSRNRRGQSAGPPKRPQSYQNSSILGRPRRAEFLDDSMQGFYAESKQPNTNRRYKDERNIEDPFLSDKSGTNPSKKLSKKHGRGYGNMRPQKHSSVASSVNANHLEVPNQSSAPQRRQQKSRKYPSSSIFAPPRSRASPVPSNAPSDVDPAEYEYSGESYSESEVLNEFPRAGNLTPSKEDYYLPLEASMDAITAYEEYRSRPLPVGNRRRGRKNSRVPTANPIVACHNAQNHIAHSAEFVPALRSRSPESGGEQTLRASVSRICSATAQPAQSIQQIDDDLNGDNTGITSVIGIEPPLDDAQAVQHPNRKYRVLDSSLGPGMGEESTFIQSPISQISLQILHNKWRINEPSVVHEDRASNLVIAPDTRDEAESDQGWDWPNQLSNNVYQPSLQTNASQDIDYHDRGNRTVSVPCFGTFDYVGTVSAGVGASDSDSGSASSQRHNYYEVFSDGLLTSRKLTDFFFNYQPESLNYRPGMGIDYDESHPDQTVRENKAGLAGNGAKPQENEIHTRIRTLSTKPSTLSQIYDDKDPFITTPLRENVSIPIDDSLNCRPKSPHRRIASEGDSSLYAIGIEPKPYTQFTIAPQSFKRPNGKQGYKITGVFESFANKSPSKVPRPLVIRKVAQLPVSPSGVLEYKMADYVSYSIRRAHTPKKQGALQSSFQDEQLSFHHNDNLPSTRRMEENPREDSNYTEYDSHTVSPPTPTPTRGIVSSTLGVPARNKAISEKSVESKISSLSLHDTAGSLSPDFAWVVARPTLTTAQKELEAELRATATRKENEKEILAVAAKEKAVRVTAATTKAVPKHKLIDIKRSPRKRTIEKNEKKKKQGIDLSPNTVEASVLERVAVIEKVDMDDRCPIMGTHTVRGIEQSKRPTILHSPPPQDKGGYSIVPSTKEYSESSGSDQDETNPDADTNFGHYAVRNRKSYNMPFTSPNASLPVRRAPGGFTGTHHSPTGKRNASEGASGRNAPQSPPNTLNTGCFQPPALYPEGTDLNADQRARQYEYLERERIRQATYRRNPAVFGDVRAVEDQRKAAMARQKGMAQCSVCARWREPGTRCCEVRVRHD